MTEYKPGDRVKHPTYGELEFVEWDEGRCTLKQVGCRGVTTTYGNIRPSELTPADPVPDTAVMLVRELCAAEYDWRDLTQAAHNAKAGHYDSDAVETAFAKYIRANPPQPLTVERVREAMRIIGIMDAFIHVNAPRLHAALTEQQP